MGFLSLFFYHYKPTIHEFFHGDFAILFIDIHSARSESFLYTYSSFKHAHLSILKLRQRLWILSFENRNNFFQIVVNDRNLFVLSVRYTAILSAYPQLFGDKRQKRLQL